MPVCPHHGVELAVSKFGGWYCKERDDNGEYCRFKIREPKPSSIAKPAAPAASLPNSDSLLAAAALNFAASLCRGSGPEMADEALAVAVKAFQQMKGIQ